MHNIDSYGNHLLIIYLLTYVDSLFSATPEVIAAHQAKRIYRVFTPWTKGSYTVLDIFCGTGSNAIQFALLGFRGNVLSIFLM